VKNLSAKKKGRKAVEKGKKATENTATRSAEEKNKKPVIGCKMIVCEDPLTGAYRLFPVKCPPGYVDKMKRRMREKGVRFSSEPFPEDAVLSTPEEEV